MPSIRQRSGSSEPDPFRVGDYLGELLDDAQQYVYLASTADTWTDHQGQLLLRRTDSPERWAICSNRWGKSDWGARECRYWLLGDHPYLRHRIHLPASGWAVSDTLDNGRDILVPKLIRHIPYEAIRRFPTREFRYFELTNGSRLGLKSCEQGRGAFQGADKSFIWWDDIEGDNPELAWECYKEGGMRIGAGQMLYQWGTMTPLCGMSELIESLEAREEAGQVFIIRGSIRDNTYLSSEAIDRALSGVTEEWERAAREHGKVTLLGGGHVFPMDIVQGKAAHDEPPSLLCSLSWDEDKPILRLAPVMPNASIAWKVWSSPSQSSRCIVSVDPAGGGKDKKDDDTVIKVFDSDAYEELACLRAKIGPAQTAIEAMKAAQFYNYALLGIEANSIGMGVIDNAREYPNLYRRHQVTDVEPKSGTKYGWYTSEALKEKMVRDLAELIEHGQIILKERETWREMLRFIRHPDKTLGAQRGHHDDGISSAMMFIQIARSPKLSDYFKNLRLIGVK